MKDFLCSAFTLFCSSDHAADVARAVPEISPDGFAAAAAVVVLGLLAMTTKGRM